MQEKNRMKRWVLMVVFVVCIPVGVVAGPPIQTDDTGTPGPDKWETNMGFTLDKRQNASRYEVPALDLNYGVGERIQLNYSVSWIVLDPKDEAAKSGIGNSEVAVKWRFLDEDKHGVAVSVYPRFIFNNPAGSADRGLVDDGTAFKLPIQMEKKIGIIDFIANFSREFHQRGSDTWIYSVAVKYAEVKGLAVLAELFGSADNGFKNAETACNIGFRKDVSENYMIMASLGRSLREGPDHPTLLSYAGLQKRF
jgi:hypothetical protein